MSRVKIMTAYGETHDAKEWAKILGVSESAVYKHMKGSRDAFIWWMCDKVGWSEDHVAEHFPGRSVAELVDRQACHIFIWKIAGLLNGWDTLSHLLSRDEAVLNVDGELAQVLEWLQFRWEANNGVWSKVLLAEEEE